MGHVVLVAMIALAPCAPDVMHLRGQDATPDVVRRALARDLPPAHVCEAVAGDAHAALAYLGSLRDHTQPAAIMQGATPREQAGEHSSKLRFAALVQEACR